MLARRTRIASLAVLSLLAAAPAAADDTSDARETMTLALSALRLGEPEVVVALMDSTVTFDLDVASCAKAVRRSGKATGKTRLVLAQCLLQLSREGSRTGTAGPQGGRVRVNTVLGDDDVAFDLRRVKGRLRIAAIERIDPDSVEGDPEGVEGGVEGGVPGGVVGGVLYEPPPPPPPPPPPRAPPMNISPQAFDAQRIAGDKVILPDDATKIEIGASGHTSFLVPIKICIDVDGKVTDVRILKSSGYPAYDQKFDREIRTWRYKPFMVNGMPAPACGMVNFSYRQS